MGATPGKGGGQVRQRIVRNREQHKALGARRVGQQLNPLAPGRSQGPPCPPPSKDAEPFNHGTSVPDPGHNGPMEWSLPPADWPRFLRQLRHPAPPPGWLEAAAELPEMRRRPLLLRWIAQHPKSPTFLRLKLLSRLPWRPLAQIADDPAAHPQARSWSHERLQALWTSLSTGERRSLAPLAPQGLWQQVWKTPDTRTLAAFLNHPKLGLPRLLALLQVPLRAPQLDALLQSRWHEQEPLAEQVLEVLDRSLGLPEHGLVLGMAAPWIKVLQPESRLFLSARLRHPPLRRMVRAWAGHRPEDLDPNRPPE